MVQAEADRFQLRAVINYKRGKGFPPGINVSQKNKIRNIASNFDLEDKRLQRSGSYEYDFSLDVFPIDSRSAQVTWTCFLPNPADYVEVKVTEKDKSDTVFYQQQPYSSGLCDVNYLEGGKNYIVKITCIQNIEADPKDWYDYVVAIASREYRSVLCIEELDELYRRAVNHIKRDKKQIITHMYRNKPQSYWDNIMYKEGGIMMPYMKDFNGDPGCPINGQIKGLFFAGRRDAKTGNLPTSSPFGNWRFVLPTHRIFDPFQKNMYFADFYCHSAHHYVTVVLTRPGSIEDIFCARYLKGLQSTDNPFFMYDIKLDRYFMSQNCYVETFYTMPVDVRTELSNYPRDCQMGPTFTIGRGCSKVMGIVKNPNCNICNLYKVKRKRDDSVGKSSSKKQKSGNGKTSVEHSSKSTDEKSSTHKSRRKSADGYNNASKKKQDTAKAKEISPENQCKSRNGKSTSPENTKVSQSVSLQRKEQMLTSKEERSVSCVIAGRPTLKAKRHVSSTIVKPLMPFAPQIQAKKDSKDNKSIIGAQPERSNIHEVKGMTSEEKIEMHLKESGHEFETREIEEISLKESCFDENFNKTCTSPIDMSLSEMLETEIETQLSVMAPVRANCEIDTCMNAKFSSDDNSTDTEAELLRLEEEAASHANVSTLNDSGIKINLDEYQVLDSVSFSEIVKDQDFPECDVNNSCLINTDKLTVISEDCPEENMDLSVDAASSQDGMDYSIDDEPQQNKMDCSIDYKPESEEKGTGTPASDTGESEITVKSFLWIEAVSVTTDSEDNLDSKEKTTSTKIIDKETDFDEEDLYDLDPEVEKSLLDGDSADEDDLDEPLDTSLLDEDFPTTTVQTTKFTDKLASLNSPDKNTKHEKSTTESFASEMLVMSHAHDEFGSNVKATNSSSCNVPVIKKDCISDSNAVNVPKNEISQSVISVSNVESKYENTNEPSRPIFSSIKSCSDEQNDRSIIIPRANCQKQLNKKLPTVNCFSHEGDDLTFFNSKSEVKSYLDSLQMPLDTKINADPISISEKDSGHIEGMGLFPENSLSKKSKDLSYQTANPLSMKICEKIPLSGHDGTIVNLYKSEVSDVENVVESGQEKELLSKDKFDELYKTSDIKHSKSHIQKSSKKQCVKHCTILPKVKMRCLFSSPCMKSKQERNQTKEVTKKIEQTGSYSLPDILCSDSDLEEGELPHSPVTFASVKTDKVDIDKDSAEEISVTASIFGDVSFESRKVHCSTPMPKVGKHKHRGISTLSEQLESKYYPSPSKSGNEVQKDLPSRVKFSSWLGNVIKKQTDKVNQKKDSPKKPLK